MYTVNKKVEKSKLWTCPKCNRKFQRKGQPHSCRAFPLLQHFKNKPEGKHLYQKLRQATRKEVGPFRVESLECCIHFASAFTFTAVKVFKNKIRVDFSLDRKIKNKRFTQFTPMSVHRYLYGVDVTRETDIDAELIEWIKEANNKKV